MTIDKLVQATREALLSMAPTYRVAGCWCPRWWDKGESHHERCQRVRDLMTEIIAMQRLKNNDHH